MFHFSQSKYVNAHFNSFVIHHCGYNKRDSTRLFKSDNVYKMHKFKFI